MKLGDRVRLKPGVSFKDMRPELTTATGTVCNVVEHDHGTEISVNYPEWGVLVPDVAIEFYDLVKAPPRQGPA